VSSTSGTNAAWAHRPFFEGLLGLGERRNGPTRKSCTPVIGGHPGTSRLDHGWQSHRGNRRADVVGAVKTGTARHVDSQLGGQRECLDLVDGNGECVLTGQRHCRPALELGPGGTNRLDRTIEVRDDHGCRSGIEESQQRINVGGRPLVQGW
jgi:hypothetical protein